MDSSHRAKAKPPSGGQQMAGSVAGKKRKKKKNGEKKNCGEGKTPLSAVPVVYVETHRPASLSNRPVHERCSSSSSVENSKPEKKLGRFDFSSDAMSVSLTSSSTAMELSGASQTGSPLPSQPHIPFALSTSTVNSSVTPSANSGTASSSTYASTSASSSSEQCKVTTDASTCSVLESLRWEKECSDEEKERERIEQYKANRRKRYENALEERRTNTVAARKPSYCVSSEIIS